MIARIWHGWTRRKDSDAYEKLLNEEVFAGIASKRIPGYKGIRLLRRTVGEEDEFVTIMWFDSWEAVKQFAGDDYEQAVVQPRARALLLRFDARSRHYELREHSDQ
jgi:heme-degrading monooxygenase HmoA